MRWIAWLLVAACASAPGPDHPRPPPGPADPAAPGQSPPPAAPSEPECDQLITHAVALGIDEQAARSAHTTASEHEAVRRSLHDDFVAGCRRLPRDAYQCAMAATTLPALAACQRTPSSSTSNSSVAPGGITPPAPRSP